MFHRVLIVPCILVAFGCLVSGSALAGGIYLPISGAPSMGTATAGSNALALDASTATQNPAGMTRLEDHSLMLGMAPGFSSIKFDQDSDTPTSGGNGGEQGGLVPITSAAYVHKVSDSVRFGLTLFSFAGAGMSPSNDWTGRNEITNLTLFTLTIDPTIGIKLTDWLSIGGGMAITYGKLDLSLRAPGPQEQRIELDSIDDFGTAPIVSFLVEPKEGLRFGVVYVGETKLNLDGDVNLPMGMSQNGTLELPIAQAVRGSAYWEATDRIALMMSAGWEDWSAAETLPLTFSGGGAAIPLEFRDTWYLGGGVHYKLFDRWTLQAGYRYDSSALKDSDRTTAFPIDQTHAVGTGVKYQWSDDLVIGTSFVWMNMGSGSVDTANAKGDYTRNDIFFFGFNLSWSKLPWSGRGTF